MALWLLLGVESSMGAGVFPQGGQAGKPRCSKDGSFNMLRLVVLLARVDEHEALVHVCEVLLAQLHLGRCEMRERATGSAVAASWQQPRSSERDAWLHGSS